MFYRLLSITLLFFFSIGCFAQISTLKIETPTNHERVVVPYDSTKNISRDILPSLIGQKVQILPRIPVGSSDLATGPTLYSSKPSGFDNNNKVVQPDTRFSIYRSRLGAFTNEVFNIIGTDSIQSDTFRYRTVKFYLIVENENYPTPHYLELGIVNDELDSNKNVERYGTLSPGSEFVLIGYFEKLRQNSIGKKYVVKYPNNSYLGGEKILYNLANGEPLNSVPENLLLTIKDVTLIDSNKYKGLAYVFSSDTEPDMFSRLYLNYFEDYNSFLAKQEKRQSWEKDMIKRYGKVNGQLIIEGRVKLGFSKKMCEESWGIPSDINTSRGSWGVHEQWVYSNGCYLYFENGKLTAIDY